MAKDWKIELIRAHTRLFHPPKGYSGAQGYPECNEGWRDLIERACVRIENALDGGDTVKIAQRLCIRVETALQENGAFEFVRIKQKFGVLRADWDGEISNDTRAKILEAIDLAVARSACTCEICGVEGRRYNNRGWLATACAEHAVGDPEPVRPGFENIRKLRRVAGEPGMYYVRYDREADTLTAVSPNSLGLEQ